MTKQEGKDEEKDFCKKKSEVSIYNAKVVPPGVRLNFERNVSLDKIRCRVDKPKRAVPPNYLPEWPEMSIDRKIPRILAPKGTFVFTRGYLSEGLFAKNAKYTVEDPFHFYRVPAQRYSALHDPHANAYIHSPAVKSQLIKNNLINSKGQVICTQRDFNIFRNYLATIYNDKVKFEIARMDEIKEKEIIQRQNLQIFEKRNMQNGKSKRDAKMMVIKEKRREKQMLEVLKSEEKERKAKENIMKSENLRQQKMLEKTLKAAEKAQKRKRAKVRAEMNNEEKQKQIMAKIVVKEKEAKLRVQNERIEKIENREKYNAEWLDKKWVSQEERLKQKATLNETFRRDLKEKARKRQEKTESHRRNLSRNIQRRKAEERRVWAIAAKYFYRWLFIVRERKARKPDEMHTSIWDITMSLEDTNTYTQKESGYEKFDDFILNVLKQKKMRSGGEGDAGRDGSQSVKASKSNKSQSSMVKDTGSKSTLNSNQSKAEIGDSKMTQSESKNKLSNSKAGKVASETELKFDPKDSDTKLSTGGGGLKTPSNSKTSLQSSTSKKSSKSNKSEKSDKSKEKEVDEDAKSKKSEKSNKSKEKEVDEDAKSKKSKSESAKSNSSKKSEK